MKILFGLCLILFAPLAFGQTISSTRETPYDFACCSDQGCTPAFASNHQQYTKAYEACVNATLADGRTRWIDGGRYRISVTKPTTPAPTPPATVLLTWTAPDRYTDGSVLPASALTYRVESKSGGVWTALTTTSGLSHQVPPGGCYRVVALATRAEGGVTIFSEGPSDPVGAPAQTACQ